LDALPVKVIAQSLQMEGHGTRSVERFSIAHRSSASGPGPEEPLPPVLAHSQFLSWLTQSLAHCPVFGDHLSLP
jgi:hypothetical protein